MNRPASLMRCIEAVMSGEMVPRELIVVDQSDDDATEELVTAYSWPSTAFRYIRQPRKGLSAARNAALSATGAAVVAMTDDDCVPDGAWLRAIDRAFTGQPARAAVTGRILPLGPDAPGLYPVSSRPSEMAAEYNRKAPPWQAASGGNFAVRRECWEHLGGFDERLGAGTRGQASEDIDFAYRLLRNGHAIRYEPGAVIFHERQPHARRITTRWTYGYGIGAFCGKWLRRRDLYALRLLGMWTAWRGRELGSALVHRRRQEAFERQLMLRGTLAGLRYGLTLGGEEQ